LTILASYRQLLGNRPLTKLLLGDEPAKVAARG
jgi:hypothetical protein